jgi:septum formation protein
MAMKAGPLLLASVSPRRVELLRQLEIPFRVEIPEVAEVMPEHLAPHEICLANAAAKARSVGARFPQHLVLGADTEVALGARVFGKPRHRREAADYLRALAGRTHQVITGVCLLCVEQRFRISFAETTHVTFRALSEKLIHAYLRRVDPRDKAGGYAVQEAGEQIIEAIEGSLSNVVGLPLAAVSEALKDLPPELRPRRDGAR